MCEICSKLTINYQNYVIDVILLVLLVILVDFEKVNAGWFKMFSIFHLTFEIFRYYFRIKQNITSIPTNTPHVFQVETVVSTLNTRGVFVGIELISRIAIFKINTKQPYHKEITLEHFKHFKSISLIIVINLTSLQELSQHVRNHCNNW